VGSIVHCAAWVNHVYPYEVLAAANAHSAAAILELAVTEHRKPVTFVSSAGVFDLSRYPVGADLPARALTAFPDEHEGYSRSKAVAEAYFARAADVGARVSVVRIPKVFGDRHAHQIQDSDSIWSWTRAMLRTGRYPSSYDEPGNELFQALPADVVARVIIEAGPPSGGPGCRFVNAVPNLVCSSRNFIAGIREAGYAVEPLADRDWYEAVSKLDPEEIWVAALAGQMATAADVESPQRLHRFSLDDDPEVSALVNSAAVWTPKDVAGYVRSLGRQV
jgi:nucleoside-diphosphate-sugar epimerase